MGFDEDDPIDNDTLEAWIIMLQLEARPGRPTVAVAAAQQEEVVRTDVAECEEALGQVITYVARTRISREAGSIKHANLGKVMESNMCKCLLFLDAILRECYLESSRQLDYSGLLKYIPTSVLDLDLLSEPRQAM